MTTVARPAPSPNSRAALLEAAYEEFVANGYEATTVAAIATRAGVTTGALYAHFSSKLDLLLATVALTPVDTLLRGAAALTSMPWSEASKFVVQGMSAQADPRLSLLLDVIVAARRDPHTARVLRAGLSTYIGALTMTNDTGIATGRFDPPVASEDLARLIVVINLGLLVFSALDQTPPSEDAFARIVDVLMQPVDAEGMNPDRSISLARVAARAIAAEHARERLYDTIVEADEAGHSLREIGALANLSHERVRQVLRARNAR